MVDALKGEIESLVALPADQLPHAEAEDVVRRLLEALNSGRVRAAQKDGDGQWSPNVWVKQGILLGFRVGRLADFSGDQLRFFDKHTYPLKPISLSDGIRVVPGGSSIRTGCFVAQGVVCMPPMYVNVGAFVDEGTMIDSHALVGSCAQVGRRVHLSAAAQVGGVLEPVGAMPVIVEDDVFVGGGSGLYEGCVVRSGAVLAPGVVLTGATRIYDLVNDTVISRAEDSHLEVPENAVVVPGSRTIRSSFAEQHGIALYTPVIVKYRDRRTDAATALETALR